MKQYVTFGQSHEHNLDGGFFDKDCVARYDASNCATGRAIAFKLFGRKFCFHYTEEDFPGEMKYFPRGFVEVPEGFVGNAKLELEYEKEKENGNQSNGNER